MRQEIYENLISGNLLSPTTTTAWMGLKNLWMASDNEKFGTRIRDFLADVDDIIRRHGGHKFPSTSEHNIKFNCEIAGEREFAF
jgi:hypothetical protein